jgi:hypothetical protein
MYLKYKEYEQTLNEKDWKMYLTVLKLNLDELLKLEMEEPKPCK